MSKTEAETGMSLADMVAESLARRAGEPRGAEHDAQAARLLADHAFRHLHNEVAQIRRDAVDEHLRGLRPPLGFWGAALAAFAGALGVAVLGLLLAAHPGWLAAILALLGA